MAASVDRSFQSLRFPNYLGTNEAPAYVRFQPIEMDFGEFKNSAPTGAGIVQGKEDNTKNKAFDKLKGNIIEKATSQFKKQATDFISGKLNIGGLSLDFDKKRDLKKTKGSINLFMPEAIAANLRLQYDEVSGAGPSRAAAGILGDILNGNPSIKDAMNEIGAGGVSGIIKSLSATNAARVVTGVGAGIVSNNVAFQLFKGVDTREFTYQWKLIAKNEKESQEIKDICDTFLFYSLPSRSVEDFEAEGQKGIFHFYDIPAMWDIDYMYKDGNMQYHQAPTTYCVLKSVDVQYSGGNSLYSDGAPLAVDLTLAFTEIEPLYRAGTNNNPNAWKVADRLNQEKQWEQDLNDFETKYGK